MLPKLRSVREGSYKFGRKTIKFRPWSNRDMIIYEDIRDNILEKKLPDDEQKIEIKEAIYQYLVKPNLIDYDKELTFIEREVLYIEIYKISRGTLIPIIYKCPKCGFKSQLNFNLATDYEFTDITNKQIKTKDFTFILKTSNYVVDKETDDNILENVRQHVSYVKEVIYKDEKITITSLDELTDWFITELDEDNFSEFMSQLEDSLPKIKLQTKCICDKCSHSDIISFSGIPDFFISPL